MRLARAWLGNALIVSILVGAGFILGCSEDTRGMKNFIPGTGPEKEMEMKRKGETPKPMPTEPPLPQPPPLKR